MSCFSNFIRATVLACVISSCGSMAQAQAQPDMTVQALIDRAKIEDMLTRYMTDLGHSAIETYTSFYADDAELIMGTNNYKGRASISGAYAAMRATPGNTRGSAHAFNTILSNPIITVHGDTATVQLIFTEVITDTAQSAPRMLVQGREYDELARVDGRWVFKKRQVVSGATPPADWRP